MSHKDSIRVQMNVNRIIYAMQWQVSMHEWRVIALRIHLFEALTSHITPSMHLVHPMAIGLH